MKEGVYGIQSFKMQNAATNGFPSSWASAYELKAIVKDSFSYNDSESSENDIEVEDMDNFYASLPSSLATKGFTIQTYDMGEDTYKYLAGYTENQTSGFFEETPGHALGNQAVQVITKAFADFPSKTFEWANLAVKITRTGNIGKSGFPNFQITFKQLVLTDANGDEIAGARWKYTETASNDTVVTDGTQNAEGDGTQTSNP